MPRGNNGNYSQVPNMIMTSGVWSTTQFESITSLQNNDKMPNTNINTTLKHYLGFDLPYTMRGMTSDLKVEMVLMMGMVRMVMKMLLPTPRRSRWQR
jgi:hypothetical protein